ncbi:MAG: type I-E CRISPR-associated protein Cas7/Cse4/CasC [Deinococcales bacterium]
MKALLEIHMLQNFAPSNLNRDDTGSPKDCEFGGYRRARISSQCSKRAMRSYVRGEKLLSDEALASRSKLLSGKLGREICALKYPDITAKDPIPGDVKAIVELALGGLELKVEEDKTQYLLYLGEREIKGLAKSIQSHWETLHKLV